MFNVFLSSFLIIPFSPLLFLELILFLFPVFVVGLVCGFRRKTNILSLTTLLRAAMFKTTARPFPRSSVSCLHEPTGGVLPPVIISEAERGSMGELPDEEHRCADSGSARSRPLYQRDRINGVIPVPHQEHCITPTKTPGSLTSCFRINVTGGRSVEDQWSTVHLLTTL